MPRPVVLPALPTSPIVAVRTAGGAAIALALATLIVCPVAVVAVQGLLASAPDWPWRVAADTLAVALAATLGALVPALLIGYTLMRLDVPGRWLVWQIFRIGVLMPPFIVSLALLALVGSHGFLAAGVPRPGLAAIVIGQAIALLPIAVALVVRVLLSVPVELEHVAEALGAPRMTIVRRVTLGLAGAGVVRAGLVLLGLCLADVATPLLLGGDARVLATIVVATAAADSSGAARAALMLAALAVPVALGGAAWRSDGAALRERAVLPRLERRVAPALRWSLGAPVWVVAAALAGLWAVVPLASLLARDARGISLEHWAVLATAAGARTLGNSVALGMGAAIGGTALALAAAWIVERQRGAAGRTVELLMRVPIVIPGLVAGVGYALVFAAPLAGFAATLPILIVLVACWELPLTARAAQAALVRSDRSVEEAAVSLGAGALTTLVRVVAPALRPVAGWMAGRLFAAGVVAVGTVIVLAGAGRELGAVTMLTLAATGATGAACAVATALVVLASGAVLLGRAIAGHHHGPTLLA